MGAIKSSDVDRYIGRTYDPNGFDCADLAALVQAELFGREILLPGRRQRRQAPQAVIARYCAELAQPIVRDELMDGDAVLFRGDVFHIGTVFHLGGCWRVLHNSRTLGCSWLHRLSDLPAMGLLIEGFYRWK